MAEGDLERRARLMAGFKIDERAVYARNITNDDLRRKDELDDVIAELRIDLTEVERQIEECEDRDERRELRSKARDLAADIRDRDAALLGLYIEDEAGERFSDEVLAALPFRVLTPLSRKATEYAYAVEEDARPTTATSDTG